MRPMLAGKFIPDKIKQLLPMYGQPKLDGIRMFVRDGIAYTRSLKPVRSEWVQNLVTEAGSVIEGLDGEIIAGPPTAEDAYRRTSSSVMSYEKPDNVTFHVFDHFLLDEKMANRKIHIFNLKLPNWCQPVETRLLTSMEDILLYEEEMLKIGYEGVILRNPESYYKYGRGSPTKGELIKLKKFLDTEAVVTGFAEFMHNSNPEMINELGHTERSSHKENLIPMETLGALFAEGRFPDGTKYKVRIGTGFDTEQRQQIWNNQDDYLGKLVKFKYFPGGVKEAPRFPVFLGFRDGDDMPKGETQLSLL